MICLLTLNSSLLDIFGETTDSEYWLTIEDEIEDLDGRLSLTYITAAQKFEITEEYANITEISVYLTYIDVAKDGKTPHGTVSILTDDNGLPGVPLSTTTLEEKFGPLDLGVSIGPTWINCLFATPIMITQGSYWIVLNDTGEQAFGSWEWFTQDDMTNGDSGDWAAKASHTGSWVLNPFPPGDMLSKIKIVPTNPPPEIPPEEEDTYSYIFTHPGNGKWSYNLTITIEDSSAIITKSNRLYRSKSNKFSLETATICVIHIPDKTSGYTSDSSDKVIYGMIRCNIKSFVEDFLLQIEPSTSTFISLTIILKLVHQTPTRTLSHNTVIILTWDHWNLGIN
ncbi:hypothetical protein [Candidatus Hodarchaeum mangrovi]